MRYYGTYSYLTPYFCEVLKFPRMKILRRLRHVFTQNAWSSTWQNTHNKMLLLSDIVCWQRTVWHSPFMFATTGTSVLAVLHNSKLDYQQHQLLSRLYRGQIYLHKTLLRLISFPFVPAVATKAPVTMAHALTLVTAHAKVSRDTGYTGCKLFVSFLSPPKQNAQIRPPVHPSKSFRSII